MMVSWGLGLDVIIGSSLPCQYLSDFEHSFLELLPFAIEVYTWFAGLDLLGFII
jgi:hypothetical protein